MTQRPDKFIVHVTFTGQDAADIDAIARATGKSRRAVVRSIVAEVLADDRTAHERERAA